MSIMSHTQRHTPQVHLHPYIYLFSMLFIFLARGTKNNPVRRPVICTRTVFLPTQKGFLLFLLKTLIHIFHVIQKPLDFNC